VLCIKCYNQNARVLTDTNNLIVNGGFENGCPARPSGDTSFCPNSYNYHCDIANWTCIGGGSSTYAHIVDSNFSIIVEGTKAAYFGNSFCNSCSAILSDTSCISISNTGCEVTGIPVGYPNNDTAYGGTIGVSLSQTVNGLTVGNIYLLEFWAGGEPNGSIFTRKGLLAIDIGFGKIFLRDPPTRPHIGIGTRYVIAFTADSSSHTIKFTNWGHIGTDSGYNKCTELILDDVQLFKKEHNSTSNPCDLITNVNDLRQNTIATVFPNPATNLLTVTITSPRSALGGETAANSLLGDGDEIILFDITSRQLMQEKFIGSATLNIENLAKGVYLYQVKDEKGIMKQGRVVKE
jgi:hypothetical protein